MEAITIIKKKKKRPCFALLSAIQKEGEWGRSLNSILFFFLHWYYFQRKLSAKEERQEARKELTFMNGTKLVSN